MYCWALPVIIDIVECKYFIPLGIHEVSTGRVGSMDLNFVLLQVDLHDTGMEMQIQNADFIFD